MKFTRLFPLAALAAPIAMLGACAGETPADDSEAAASDQPTIIDERQANFEAIGDNFKLIRAELETDGPDFAAIGNAAGDINAKAKLISGHFPEGTSIDAGYDTEALPSIWEKPEEFDAAIQKLVTESAAFAAVASSGDKAAVAEQVKALGGSCKNCHDQFRVDDD